MSVSDKSIEIVNQFCKYITTGNKTLIESYSLEELKRAKYEYSQDSYREFYEAIEDRIKELEKISDEKKRRKDKWLYTIATTILTIVVALLIVYLKGCLRLGAV